MNILFVLPMFAADLSKTNKIFRTRSNKENKRKYE